MWQCLWPTIPFLHNRMREEISVSQTSWIDRWEVRLNFSYGVDLILWNAKYLPVGNMEYYQFSSVAQLCPTLCDPMNRSTPGVLPVLSKSLAMDTGKPWITVLDEFLFCSTREREQLAECVFLQGRILVLSLDHWALQKIKMHSLWQITLKQSKGREMERLMNLLVTVVVPSPENSDDGEYVMSRVWNLQGVEIQMYRV